MYKLIVLAAVLVLTNTAAMAQDTGSKMSRKERKAQETAENSAKYAAAVEALNQNEFVIEADQLFTATGRPVVVNPIYNFIYLSEEKAVVQVAPNQAMLGPNWLGGITLEGKPSDIQISTDKKGNVFLRMNIFGIGISATVFITVTSQSNQATARITADTSTGGFNMIGTMYNFADANIFKGSSL